MKILVVCPFDPCGVAAGHRTLMRAAGHDYRVAVDFTADANRPAADWVGWGGAHLREFAHDADVIQWCPGIGRGGGWSIDAGSPFGMDDIPWQFFDSCNPGARRVAYFHGSVATWTHREKYAAFYGGRGWRLATSTLDYATELPAAYLPPYVTDLPRASLRADGSPLIVAHTPTNPSNCHTAEFFGMTQRLRWKFGAQAPVIKFASGISHEAVLALKAQSHACFDHLRGSFSVNALEAAAMGLVPLVGLRETYLRDGVLAPRPRIETLEELRDELVKLADDAEYTRELQLAAHEWFEKHFSAAAITRRLLAFYGALWP